MFRIPFFLSWYSGMSWNGEIGTPLSARSKKMRKSLVNGRPDFLVMYLPFLTSVLSEDDVAIFLVLDSAA